MIIHINSYDSKAKQHQAECYNFRAEKQPDQKYSQQKSTDNIISRGKPRPEKHDEKGKKYQCRTGVRLKNDQDDGGQQKREGNDLGTQVPQVSIISAEKPRQGKACTEFGQF